MKHAPKLVLPALAVVVIALLGIGSGRSASFDCERAAHPLERTICSDPELSRLDEELARRYREKLAVLFDKQSFRGQQRDWQRLLRANCAKGCTVADVRREIAAQRDTIAAIDHEDYEASYKTADVATLRLSHLPSGKFDFAVTRDLQGEVLCRLPAEDAEAGAVARLSSPMRASWQSGSCRIDFALTREADGNVSRIDLTASPGCKRYCRGNYRLGDSYLPANYWVAGNQ